VTYDEKIKRALISLNVDPDLVRWWYIQAAYEEEDFNKSATARRLGMHRRTLQRILEARRE
jgi:ActR/RegA family two-component response regulator